MKKKAPGAVRIETKIGVGLRYRRPKQWDGQSAIGGDGAAADGI